MNIICKFFLIAVFVFCAVANGKNLTLSHGSVVKSEDLNSLFEISDINAFLDFLEKQSIKVIAVKQGGKKNQPVFLKYLDTTGAYTLYFNTFFLQEKIKVYGLYLPEKQNKLSQEYPVILLNQEANLLVLKHEYLHHLVESNPKNKRFSKFHNKNITVLTLFEEKEGLKKELDEIKIKTHKNKTTQNLILFYGMLIEYTTLQFVTNLFRNLDEIEVYLFFLDNVKKLTLSKEDQSECVEIAEQHIDNITRLTLKLFLNLNSLDLMGKQIHTLPQTKDDATLKSMEKRKKLLLQEMKQVSEILQPSANKINKFKKDNTL